MDKATNLHVPVGEPVGSSKGVLYTPPDVQREFVTSTPIATLPLGAESSILRVGATADSSSGLES